MLLVAALSSPGPASAQVTVGFRSHFAGVSLDGWGGGSQITNPGTGGLGGVSDGYLQVAVPGPFAGNLGSFALTPDYAGNWTTAGVTQVRLWLNDVNAADDLEIHLSIGNGASGNFWQCNTGLIPPHDTWAPFTVNLNPANFTFTGTIPGTFAAALQNVDRVLLRHDKAPYVRTPDTVIGDFGVDEILLSNGTLGVPQLGGPGARTPVQLAPPGPNPSRGPVTFRLTSAATVPVRMQIVDAMGRIVRHAQVQAGGSGEAAWVWDGSGDDGRMVAAGAYRVRAIGPDGGMSQPIVRVK
jgi:hypothetical protein